MNSLKETRRYVVHLSLDGMSGLGVVVPGHILTCAHFFATVGVDHWIWLEVVGEISGEDKCVYYVQTLDSLMDFMVLGDNPLEQDVDSGSLIENIDPPLKPVRLVFSEKEARVTIPVYYYAPDGTTPIHTIATVHRDSPSIALDHSVDKGSSGSPLFTANHKLIGIVLGQFKWGGVQPVQGHAIRIDQAATGWLCDELGGFDEHRIRSEVAKGEESCASDPVISALVEVVRG